MRGQELPQATMQHGTFAFPDESGTRLLTTSGLMQPTMLHTALCSGGGRFPVQFESRQAEREGHNGRETSYNFDNLAGAVYKVLKGKLDSGASCFLISDVLLSSAAVLPAQRPEASGQCDTVVRRRLASSRSRDLVNCWPIARLPEERLIVLVEFARRDKDALASVVVIDGERMIFADYPRVFRGQGQTLWRVDDEGILRADGFRVVFLVQRGDSYALGVDWLGDEGDSLSVFISDGDRRFIEVVRDYWYRAPV